jgi:cytochrome c556
MRALILLLLGLAVGAIAATSVVNALRQRDAYPRGLMNVLQHHYATLRHDVRDKRCTDSPRRVAALKALVADIDGAMYPGASPEPPFIEYEQRLSDALNAAATATDQCAALAPAVDKIGAACDACHHQYR